MKLIVGLGNPGIFYSGTRHNIGSTVVRVLAKRNGISLRRDRTTQALCGTGSVGSQEVVLAVPLTYMNLSGRPVAALVDKYALTGSDLLVVCDDLDLEVGCLRIRKSGSSGGHRGLASVIQVLGRQDFNRLRIGIGRPPVRRDKGVSDYVLSGFSKSDKQILRDVIDEAADCCQDWISYGIDKCMNYFNRKHAKTP